MKYLKILMLAWIPAVFVLSCDPIPQSDVGVGYRLILETEGDQFLQNLAGDNADSLFQLTIERTREIHQKGEKDWVKAFLAASGEVGNSELERWFPGDLTDLPEGAHREDLVEWLHKQFGLAMERNSEVIAGRAQWFAANKATVNLDMIDFQITIEAGDVLDPVRYRNMLIAPGKLGFWRTESRKECYPLVMRINELSTQMEPVDSSRLPVEDIFELSPEQEMQKFIVLNPFLALFDLEVSMDPNHATVGYAQVGDTAKMNHFIQAASEKGLMENNQLLWMSHPEILFEDKEPLIALVCIKTNAGNSPDLDGSCIVSARVDFVPETLEPMVSVQMDDEGAQTWLRLTSSETNRQIAIVFDGKVLSAPNVTGKIEGGKSMISGGFTVEEAQDLASVLSAGSLAIPVSIVSEIVGE